MEREQIIAMARESGAYPYTNRHYPDRPFHTFSPEQLEAFAQLVAAQERDECAKVCEKLAHTAATPGSAAEWIRLECAEEIRARK
jgi:hypothetical protein